MNPAPAHQRLAGSRGYTLIEILVASFVFALLGTLLVQSVAGAMKAWQTAEARREVYERAQLGISMIRDDVSSMFCDTRLGRDRSVRLKVQERRQGNADLRFVRRIREELNRTVTREAGERIDAKSYRSMRNDPGSALLAGEGLEEVLYAFRSEAGKGVLWRGVRSPIGGKGSLFGLDLDKPIAGGDGVQRREDPLPLAAMPLVTGVLYFGVRLWDPRATTSWDASEKGVGGPKRAWDSADKVGIFPDLVRVTLVLETDPVLRRGTSLGSDVSAGAAAIPVEDISRLPDPGGGSPFVKIEDEWIKYTGRDAVKGKLLGCKRGQRGTQPAAHGAGKRVRQGYSFVVVFSVRAAR